MATKRSFESSIVIKYLPNKWFKSGGAHSEMSYQRGRLTDSLGIKRIVVAAYGKDIDMRIVKLIHKPILLAQSPRPKAGKVMPKGFGFS